MCVIQIIFNLYISIGDCCHSKENKDSTARLVNPGSSLKFYLWITLSLEQILIFIIRKESIIRINKQTSKTLIG